MAIVARLESMTFFFRATLKIIVIPGIKTTRAVAVEKIVDSG